jgi:hypothetical protein
MGGRAGVRTGGRITKCCGCVGHSGSIGSICMCICICICTCMCIYVYVYLIECKSTVAVVSQQQQQQQPVNFALQFLLHGRVIHQPTYINDLRRRKPPCQTRVDLSRGRRKASLTHTLNQPTCDRTGADAEAHSDSARRDRLETSSLDSLLVLVLGNHDTSMNNIG